MVVKRDTPGLGAATECTADSPQARDASMRMTRVGHLGMLRAMYGDHMDGGWWAWMAAKGHTQIKVRNDGTIEFKTQILNRDHETFVAGHIHQAPVGVAGAIVVPLFVSPTPATNARHIRQSGVATPNAGTTGAAICQNPSAYYVNYHTTAFP